MNCCRDKRRKELPRSLLPYNLLGVPRRKPGPSKLHPSSGGTLEQREPASLLTVGQMDQSSQSSTSTPTVSVIIPAYNAAAHIADALRSVFAQTYRGFEVIIINDGSSDTEELERTIEPYRDRIVYMKQENRGPAAARNAGILRARGVFLAFLDSDDAWYPDYLTEQIRMIEEDHSLDLVYSDFFYFTDSGSDGTRYMQKCPSNGPVTFESLVREDCAIPTSQTLARKSAVIKAGLFDDRFWCSEDYDLWLRMAYCGARMSYQRRPLGRHRVRAGSLASDDVTLLDAMVRVLTKLDTTLDLSADSRSVLRDKLELVTAERDLALAKVSLACGDLEQALISMGKANASLRRPKLQLVLWGLKVAPRLTHFMLGILWHLECGSPRKELGGAA